MPHHKDSEPGLAPCATPEYSTRRCPNARLARSSSLLLPLPAECGPVLSAIEISSRPFYGSESKRTAVRDIPKPVGSRRRSTRPDPSTDGHHVRTRVAVDCRAAAIWRRPLLCALQTPLYTSRQVGWTHKANRKCLQMQVKAGAVET